MKKTKNYTTLQDVWYPYHWPWLIIVRPANKPTIIIVAFAEKCWVPLGFTAWLHCSLQCGTKTCPIQPVKPTCRICFGAGFPLCLYEKDTKDKKSVRTWEPLPCWTGKNITIL
jgi:hypothetical protein